MKKRKKVSKFKKLTEGWFGYIFYAVLGIIIAFLVNQALGFALQGSSNYRVGDVIVYSIHGQSIPVIHRIIKINADGSFQTKGDHNSNQLPFEFSIKKDQIHGKVIFIIPKLGYFKVVISRLLGGLV